MKEKLAVYILNYNTYEKSCVCIESILKIKTYDIEIVLVDNASSDDSLEKLELIYKDRIRFLKNTINSGFSGGNNLAVSDADLHEFEYAYLLNSDTEVIGEHHFEVLLNVMEKNSDCVVVAPQVYDYTNSGLELTEAKSIYLSLLRRTGVLKIQKESDENTVSVAEVHGAALLVRVKDFLEIGGFPEKYFMYVEESTFEKKVIWNKKKILLLKDNSNYVVHYHPKTGIVLPWQRYLMGRNHALEYYDNRSKYLLRWGVIYFFMYVYYKLKALGNSQFRIYVLGMEDGKKIIKCKKNEIEIYNHALYMKKKFEEDKEFSCLYDYKGL